MAKLYKFITKSKLHCIGFSFFMALLDFFVVTRIFNDKWSISRAIIVAITVSLLLFFTQGVKK